MKGFLTEQKFSEPWSVEQRIISLRNCAYLMITSNNVWADINPLQVIASRGLADHVTVKRFQQIWDQELDRFNRERLTKVPPNSPCGVEGK